ncbi:MAG: hypothetical protein CM1200mP18_16190 [Gammaproteobacteria bacterium]|nr:MAG: hypothetical protein CM1200mP18_16190 [Gammaproteobacteria bacterium]
METYSDNRLVVAISSRALFDLEESHRVFTEEGVDAYCQYQISHEDEVLKPGVAFSLTRKLLNLNRLERTNRRVEVVLIPATVLTRALRIFNSISH